MPTALQGFRENNRERRGVGPPCQHSRAFSASGKGLKRWPLILSPTLRSVGGNFQVEGLWRLPACSARGLERNLNFAANPARCECEVNRTAELVRDQMANDAGAVSAVG